MPQVQRKKKKWNTFPKKNLQLNDMFRLFVCYFFFLFLFISFFFLFLCFFVSLFKKTINK